MNEEIFNGMINIIETLQKKRKLYFWLLILMWVIYVIENGILFRGIDSIVLNTDDMG